MPYVHIETRAARNAVDKRLLTQSAPCYKGHIQQIKAGLFIYRAEVALLLATAAYLLPKLNEAHSSGKVLIFFFKCIFYFIFTTFRGASEGNSHRQVSVHGDHAYCSIYVGKVSNLTH